MMPSSTPALPYLSPSSPSRQAFRWPVITIASVEWFCLQTAHRLGAIALFAIIAAWAMVYRSQNAHWPIAVAFGASDVAFCAALIARMLAKSNRRGEAMGALIFNLIILVMSLQMLIYSRLDVIRAAADKFFTPT